MRNKVLRFLKLATVASVSAFLFCWYFQGSKNTENFWKGIGSAVSWVAAFSSAQTHPAPADQAHDSNPTADLPFMAPPLPSQDELSNSDPIASNSAQTDCSVNPPDPDEDPHATADLPPFMAPPLPPYDPEETHVKLMKRRSQHGKPLRFEKMKIQGIPLYKTTIDLDDPETFITVDLANNAKQANSNRATHGDEEFDSFLKRTHGAFAANGTFFSKDAEKRVMGNLVTAGEFRKYSRWENYGTTLGIKENNELEMVTARLEGQPAWNTYWFSVTCGPRLLSKGQVAVTPEEEGFTDSHVLTIGPRSAIGYNSKKKQLIHASFLRGLSLEQAAKLMKALGCDEAMNLDGGASRALAHDGSVVIKAGRPLTNVLVVYDAKHKAPPDLVTSWERFQEGQRPTFPQ